MAGKLKAELWDKLHFLFRDYNDRMVHLRLDYDFEIDEQAFKTVLICFFEKAPVFHSKFCDNPWDPYWQIRKYSIDDVVTVKHIGDDETDGEVDAFLTQCLPTDGDLQMKALLLYHGGKTTLCILENHMCMDGGDFKYFTKALCANYNSYVDEGVSPLDFKQGSRSYTAVYEDFTPAEQKAAKNLYRNINEKDNHAFPFAPESENDKSFIAKRKLSPEKFALIRSEGKKYGATINDMLTAAYFYSLYELAQFDEKEGFSVSCAIDLRRHIKDSGVTGMTNHTAWMQCSVPEKGRDIFETLKYVTRSVSRFKRDKYMGLYGLPLLHLGYHIMPYAASEKVIKIGYSNPLLAMSNIGILDVNALALSGHEPTDGFMSGAVKFKPYALLSVTSMRDEITLSMCVRGSEEDKKIVEKFFDLLEKNIDILIGKDREENGNE